MRKLIMLCRMTGVPCLVLIYEWLSPVPVNRWVILALAAVALTPFEGFVLGQKAEGAVKKRSKMTPALFWSIAILAFLGFASYLFGEMVMRHEEDSMIVRLALFAVFAGIGLVIRDQVRDGAPE